jgi:hypothetical protein
MYPRRQMSPSQVESVVKDTRVIISFGAREGGFELAAALRDDIMKKYNNKSESFVYLDAESARLAEGTKYNPSMTHDGKYQYGWRMHSDYWDDLFYGAIGKAQVMLFFVTEMWFRSSWCWMEFEWCKEWIAKGHKIKPILIFFKDAWVLRHDSELEATGTTPGSKVIVQPNRLVNFWNQQENAERIYLRTWSPVGGAVSFDNGKGGEDTYQYQYTYTCSKEEREKILNMVTVKPG